MSKNKFISKFKENPDQNQQWYSEESIKQMVEEIESNSTKIAFLSTPSLYYSLTNDSLKQSSIVFDFDDALSKRIKNNFIKYDFNKPLEFPDEQLGQFDMIVIDPPFITREVWSQQAISAKALMKEGGKVIGTSVMENELMLDELLGLKKGEWQPVIPNLVYQYNVFVNQDSKLKHIKNIEITI